MNRNHPSRNRKQAEPRAEPMRGRVLFVSAGFAVLIIVVAIGLKSDPAAPIAEPVNHPAVAPKPRPQQHLANFPVIAPAPTVVKITNEMVLANEDAPTTNLVTTPSQLVAELATITGANGPITKEQAEKFKQNLAALIQQGASSVPAIREFLDKNVDSEYVEAEGGDQLGYSSLRASLFDALRQIGGPEAQAAVLDALQTTAVPAELLELSKNLEQQAPGQYREQILDAANQALEMASANQLGSNVEVGPVFRVIETVRGANHQ